MPTVRNGDCSIWYDTMGTGPPVLMVYGIGGNSRNWWEEFPPLLAQRYQLVFVDNRGTGFSDHPEEPWTISHMTSDVDAVVEELGLQSFHLLGCSLGSIIARHYVREFGGSRLRSLSLVCPPNGITATEEDIQAALFWDRTKGLIENARKSWPIVHPESWVAANEPLLLRKFEESMANPTPPRTFQFQLEAVREAPDPNPSLNDYDWPVLILHGDADRLVPPANATSLHEVVPRAALEWMPGHGHSLWQHDPAGTAAHVLGFLDRAERARKPD
ncbi:MAG: alpha/beta hydrolase [Dehalococcoidia bacterium]